MLSSCVSTWFLMPLTHLCFHTTIQKVGGLYTDLFAPVYFFPNCKKRLHLHKSENFHLGCKVSRPARLSTGFENQLSRSQKECRRRSSACKLLVPVFQCGIILFISEEPLRMAKRGCEQLTAAGPAHSSAAGQGPVGAQGYVRQQPWRHLRTFWSYPSSTEAAATVCSVLPRQVMVTRGRGTMSPRPAASLGLGEGWMALTDAQHPDREELGPWPFIYPLLHNQDAPGMQEKFLSQG